MPVSSLAALAIGAVLVALIQSARVPAPMEDALGQMGFDPDRAALITGLLLEFLIVAVATVLAGASALTLVPGAATLALVFGGTFATETGSAITARGPAGVFDPTGWAITLGVLAIFGLLIGSAAVVLAASARTVIGAAIGDLVRAARERRLHPRLFGSIGVVVLVVLSVGAVPFMADMVNYTPDVHMVSGGQLPGGIPTTAGDPGAGSSLGSVPLGTAGATGIVPAAGSALPTSSSKPWLAWRPSGTGTVRVVSLPGPWIGGAAAVSATVYLPAGYASGTRRYPVVYEVPWGQGGWTVDVHLFQQMDALIASGALPPQIVVLVASNGGPYPDSECINAFDGREWFDRYLVNTVVPYMDGRYRTIARPAARAVMGLSQGGYCAPMLLLRHPDVFSSAIAFSGYYTAAIRSSQTPNAWRPYGGDRALIDATSPVLQVAALAQADRGGLFIELSANPASAFYGPQYRTFGAAVHRAGVALALFPSPTGHSWVTVRNQLPEVLGALAAREVVTGVFR